MRREVDEAMRETTAPCPRSPTCSPSPPRRRSHTATIHRVEVLLLQPRVVMVVVIASNGGVTKRVFTFEREVDPGLVEWASSYLNERLAGLGLGARMIGRPPRATPSSGRQETEFLAEIASAFTDLDEAAEDSLYVEGAARLLSEEHAADLPHADDLMRALERRANVLRASCARRSTSARSSSGSATRTRSRSCARSASSAPTTASATATSARSGWSGRCGWTTRRRSPRCATPPGELSRFFETVYDE